jgi:hypothetical protein
MVRPLAFRERSHGSEAVSVNYATKKTRRSLATPLACAAILSPYRS